MRLPLASLVAASAALLPVTAAASSEPPLILARPGFASLQLLRHSPIVLHERSNAMLDTVSVPYRLPASADERPGHWYVLRLHAEVVFRSDTLPGSLNLSVDTNGRTVASINFEVTRKDGRPVITSDALGLVRGLERNTSSRLSREIRFENYLQYQGVRPGRNTITFYGTANAVGMIKYIRIYADTGLELKASGPSSATLTPHISPTTPRVGDRIRIAFTLTRTSGAGIPRAVVQVCTNTESLQPRSPTKVTLHWGSPRTVSGEFSFSARKAGTTPVELVADAGGQFPRVETAVRVQAAKSSRVPFALALLAGIFVLAGLGVLARRRLRNGR